MTDPASISLHPGSAHMAFWLLEQLANERLGIPLNVSVLMLIHELDDSRKAAILRELHEQGLVEDVANVLSITDAGLRFYQENAENSFFL